MSKMTPAVEQWSMFSASQNLPAVLNDPNKGKQSNFFTRTWGDNFVESANPGKSPFLPEVGYAHFESFLRKYSRRYRRHVRLSQNKLDVKSKSKNDSSQNDNVLSKIPGYFFDQTFPLNSSEMFNNVFGDIWKNNINPSKASEYALQEKLSHYLDYVEELIAKQVSQKSDAFFHAMTSHDTIMEEMGSACEQVRLLRSKIYGIDKTLARDSLGMLGLVRSRNNYNSLLDKLKLMATVLQTQPTLQLLLSSSDYVGALELIASTQEVLSKELAGVTCLRHLPSQLKEMSRLIDKMLSTEFERYAAADLNRPLDDVAGVLESERLISLTAGLLRQSHLQFLEVYKQEAITAAQAIVKQLVIEQLADVEDDVEHCLTGSGEAPPSLDSSQWLKALNLISNALNKLIGRVKAVHDVIKQTTDSSAGLNGSEEAVTINDRFLTKNEHSLIIAKLKNLLISVCDYCSERLASLVSTHSDKQTITAFEITNLSTVVENFSNLCESVCGKSSHALKAEFKKQAASYVQKFHSQRKQKLMLILDAERWKVADVPPEFQILVDNISSGRPLQSLPSSPDRDTNSSIVSEYGTECTKTANSLLIGTQEYVTVGTVLILIRLIVEYCVCAYDLPILATVIGRNLAELLRTFNSRCCQLVLGAGAIKTAGLNTITSTNLALTSRALQLVLWLIPHIRAQFSSLVRDSFIALDGVEKDIGHHIQQLESKILSLMNQLLNDQLNDWDAKPPVPSKAFRNVSRHLNKLHDALKSVLPEEQIADIYEVIHKNFKVRLREQLIKMNIENNGGPQHGVVTSEIVFYTETLKSLKVLPEKYITEKSMEEIWIR
ncbi:vacuolar protein sorting-associated protein 54 [Agrilus planipennis]|uniref:Vacuolar protein sorting-associated protein 54 n=1 Tax=Agrilus planipennis TaxID=224129 RepID=A0A1W4WXB3_AGRPL|nr:vacuolar protein sorting-associated protein 54 [Agrilus planipennis]